MDRKRISCKGGGGNSEKDKKWDGEAGGGGYGRLEKDLEWRMWTRESGGNG